MKLKTLLSTTIMLAALFCCTMYANAATIVSSGSCGENVTWSLDSEGLLTISGTGDMTSSPWQTSHSSSIKIVVIENGVTSIASNAFSYCYGLSAITIPDGMLSIGADAFNYCLKLSSINIPDSVTSIGSQAFNECSALASVTLPAGITSINQYTFYKCTSLTSIILPEKVSSIGMYAFGKCSKLGNVTLPAAITDIAFGAFIQCGNLSSVCYYGTETDWNNININGDNESLTNLTPTYVSSVLADGTCGDNLTWSLDRNGLLIISGDGEMSNFDSAAAPWYSNRENIKSVTIEDGVTNIGTYAFDGCNNFSDITLTKSTASIGAYAFYGCESLASIYYYGTEDKWTAVTIGSGNEYLTSLTPTYVRTIIASGTCGDNGTWTLDNDGLLIISGEGKMGDINSFSLAPWSSRQDDIKTVIIERGITTIVDNAFYNCKNLSSVSIPDSVT